MRPTGLHGDEPRADDGSRGSALLLVTFGMLLLCVLGLALALLAASETLVAGNHRNALAAKHAAEAVLERTMPDLQRASDWQHVLAGAVRSGFVDGPPSGARTLGTLNVSLDRVVNLANCGTDAPCSDADMDLVTRDRPWGRNNPRWRLFAHGPLDGLRPRSSPPTGFYLVVLVADDPAENDDDPGHDGKSAANPGSGVLVLRAEAFGPNGAHQAIEATVARAVDAGAGEDYAGQRAQSAAGPTARRPGIQVPGAAVARSEMSIIQGGLREAR